MKPFCNWKLSLVLVLAVGMEVNQTVCLANDDQNAAGKDGKAIKPSVRPIEQKAYLGLMIEDLHPAIASHLPGVASAGQGVLVQSVSPNSPAAKAGIKEHDILLTYGDQKLFTHEQLSKLVDNDQPGNDVEVRLIREGKHQTVKVQLGERPADWGGPGLLDEPRRLQRLGWRRGQPRLGPATNNRASWNHIDSITIKRLEKNRFNAMLTHYNKEGKLEKHAYEGTREELRKLIDADDELKANERYHLLRSLDIADYPNPWALFPEDDSSSF